MLLNLPNELLWDILSTALIQHQTPSHIVSTHSRLRDVGYHVLYTRLRFHTVRQLAQFSQQTNAIPCTPRELSVALSGGTADFNVFRYLTGALRRCAGAYGKGCERAPLDVLSLCLNSHASNPNLEDVYSALVIANPRAFVWTGPDPGHHFSIAVVPVATCYLFQAIATWTNVEDVTITNVAFPPPDSPVERDGITYRIPLLPVLPSLRSFYLGMATFLPPSAIAATVLLEDFEHLEQLRLVDAYRESIWGPRIRRKDVERALLDILSGDDATSALERVRRVVRCEAKTERIMGGDRVEGLTVLD